MPEVIDDSTAVTGEELSPLSHIYMFRNPEAVDTYLRRYPFLPALLREVAEKLHNYFGAVPLALELLTDPEDWSEKLVVLVEQGSLTLDDLFARRHRFLNEWWVQNAYRAENLFFVTLD